MELVNKIQENNQENIQVEYDNTLGTEVVFKGRVLHIIFPRTTHTSGQFAIAKFLVEEVVSGALYSDGFDDNPFMKLKHREILVKGEMPALNYADTYIIRGELQEHEKYGLQYQVLTIRTDYKLDTEEEQKKFLSLILTEKQITNLYETLPNPIQAIEDGDIQTLTTVKGIGETVVQRILQRYNDNKDFGGAYMVLMDYGLTQNAINKIIKTLGSPDTAIQVVKDNPYSLIDLVDGFGWKRADFVAKQQGMKNSDKRRVKAYCRFYLTELAESEGSSWDDMDNFLSYVQEECRPISDDTLISYVKDFMMPDEKGYPLLTYDEETGRVSLMYYYQIEKQIAQELRRIKNGTKKIKFTEEDKLKAIQDAQVENGWDYTQEQLDAMSSVLYSSASIITGKAGCVDADTEFFTGSGWKRIADYKQGDKVLQYNESGDAELVEPIGYIKEPCEQLWHFETKYGLNQCLSEEHRVPYITSKNNLFVRTFKEIKDRQTHGSGFEGRFITSFNYGSEGIDLTDEEIKVMCAVICDGHFSSKKEGDRKCRINLKRADKKERILQLLEGAGIIYEKKKYNPKDLEYSSFLFEAPYRSKIFGEEWYRCSISQLEIVCSEIIHWDGSTRAGRTSFSTTEKQTADFIQFAFTACGYKAVIQTYNRVGQPYLTHGKMYIRKNIEYNVSITKRKLTALNTRPGNKTPIKPYQTTDGYKYCFSVPSTFWVMRRGDRICVTGNSGKSHTLKVVTNLWKEQGVDFAQVALSGRASSKLTEVTGVQGQTIHRLLQYNPNTGEFKKGKQDPLDLDAVIVDEMSFVGGELFLSLLKAIPSTCQLVLVGDARQLPPLGCANVFKDILTTKYVPISDLQQIHRQAARSGIIMESLKVSIGEQLFSAGYEGEEIRGDLKDLKLVIYGDGQLSQKKVIDEFKHLYLTRGISIKDIQVIVPLKDRGNISCKALNDEIQHIVMGDSHFTSLEVPYYNSDGVYKVRYHVGDKIIIMKNNYNTQTPDGRDEPIFNGNIGYVKTINRDEIIVTLTDQGDVVLTREDWNNMQLGYAVTVHKKQGDSSPFIIFGVDMTSFPLLSKELVYTAITRARRECIIVAQNTAFRRAISTVGSDKRTWLKDIFINELSQQEEMT